ncbi:uncharacterized protein LOC129743125 [Uranotaenia lowii]|uniref:uncharacterized protein LOC129743125 n=1 Tax=Uranotaenia lowii TaxID=190385 RepID=UPI0024795F98|nr:uncharacterized protein LOC129743125 [Uranotaenia lowii]
MHICADFSTGLNDALESNNTLYHCRRTSSIVWLAVPCSATSTSSTPTYKCRWLKKVGSSNQERLGAFLQIMDVMFSRIPCITPFIDDILVVGRSPDEHKRNLRLTLQRMEEYGFTLKIQKCRFFMRQVKYLGQLLNSQDIRPDQDKVKAIVNMPPHHDVSSFRSYLLRKVHPGNDIGDKEDETLQQVMRFVQHAWPDKKSFTGASDVQQFFARLGVVVCRTEGFDV